MLRFIYQPFGYTSGNQVGELPGLVGRAPPAIRWAKGPRVTEGVKVPHVVRGEVIFGEEVTHRSRVGATFLTARLDLDALVRRRTEPGPAFDVPLEEILDLLAETGRRLADESNPYVAEALSLMCTSSPHSRRLVENCYQALVRSFDAGTLGYRVDRELGPAVIDGWSPVHKPGFPRSHVRAFPPRLVHVMAGNAPAAAASSIIQGALTKGVNLLKLPSNDPFTATAILRTMADIDKDHPTVKSFSAAYWRGGDATVESLIYRPQYFDKLVAWGGEGTIRHALKYVGPGFELVQFDPKVSISMIGREAFNDQETLDRVADLAAEDVNLMNQEACAASRYHYVEGAVNDVDRYCEALARQLSVDRFWGDGQSWRTPSEIRDLAEGLRYTGEHAVFGQYDGHGLVIRSPDPVEFHPIAKTVSVVPVPSLAVAVDYASVATQTVGIYPSKRKAELRDRLVNSGVQRVVPLGQAMGIAAGLPHDGFFPLHRLMRWVADEGDD